MSRLLLCEPRLGIVRSDSAKTTETNGIEATVGVVTVGKSALGKHENFPILSGSTAPSRLTGNGATPAMEKWHGGVSLTLLFQCVPQCITSHLMRYER